MRKWVSAFVLVCKYEQECVCVLMTAQKNLASETRLFCDATVGPRPGFCFQFFILI